MRFRINFLTCTNLVRNWKITQFVDRRLHTANKAVVYRTIIGGREGGREGGISIIVSTHYLQLEVYISSHFTFLYIFLFCTWTNFAKWHRRGRRRRRRRPWSSELFNKPFYVTVVVYPPPFFLYVSLAFHVYQYLEGEKWFNNFSH